MKKMNIIIYFLLSFTAFAQYEYEPSEEFPFGKPNPEAPEQIKDYALMIGECNCKSSSRKPDGNWSEEIDMVWRFKYIMDGKAVQDETLKVDGVHSGSIRQFDTNNKWYVHYYSTKGTPKTLPAWEGKKENGKITLYREQKAPNGTEGFYRLSFYNISKKGYHWIGEWVNKNETIIYPTWKIECKRKD